MTALVKPAVRDAWADNAVPTTDILDPGNAFAALGWLQSSTPPARQFFNWVLNYCMNGVRFLCRRGVCDWDIAETYSLNDVTLGDDGIVRQSLQNANTGKAPSGNPTFWGPLTGYATTASLSGFITAAQLASTLLGYVTTSQLATAIANFVTNASLASTLTAYVTNSSLASTLSSYVTNSSLASTLTSYVTNSSLASTLTGYATTSALATTNAALASEATTARNAGNLSGGTVPNARLPNIGSMPGVTIAADPGTTPSGSPGQMFLYF